MNKNTNKHSLYLPDDMLEEVDAEAKRQCRSVSQIMQFAWKIARERVKLLRHPIEPGDIEPGDSKP